MEWKMEVYSPDLELLGILETYDALVVEQWAFEPGSFSLQSVLTPQTRDLLRPENILWLEGETAGIIEAVQASVSESGDILSVKGPLLDGILSRRILWGQYNLYGSPPALLYEVVRDCAISPTRGSAAQRTIPHLALAGEAPEDARRIRKQSTGDTLTDFLTEVGQANGVAHGVRFNPVVPQMEFWARLGLDRTVHQTAVDPVLYSTELDDVLSSEYAYDASGYRNVALVAGEGEGAERRTETIFVPPSGEPGGLSRRETYVDARDLQSNADPDEPMTEEEYLEALKTRGKENLSDHQLVQSFSATVRTLDPTYVYGVDFFLGDTITVTDERLGLSVSALVEGVERSVGKNGEDLILTLGYGLPTLGDRLRKAGV